MRWAKAASRRCAPAAGAARSSARTRRPGPWTRCSRQSKPAICTSGMRQSRRSGRRARRSSGFACPPSPKPSTTVEFKLAGPHVAAAAPFRDRVRSALPGRFSDPASACLTPSLLDRTRGSRGVQSARPRSKRNASIPQCVPKTGQIKLKGMKGAYRSRPSARPRPRSSQMGDRPRNRDPRVGRDADRCAAFCRGGLDGLPRRVSVDEAGLQPRRC